MGQRNRVYFTADVHLGLRMGDSAEREMRFVRFLKSIPKEQTRALYLLGDIWDFWFEYHDVVPRCGTKVIASLIELMDAGVEVWFCTGNHDLWIFSYFEELGMRRFEQPYFVQIEDKVFCLAHGDGLGEVSKGYRLLMKVFKSKFAIRLFSMIHPRIAYAFGLWWSVSNRKRHLSYKFRGESEPLYKFALQVLEQKHVDYFIFGHYHDAVNIELPRGSRFIIMKDWISGGESYGLFSASSFELHSPKSSI